MGFHFLLQGIFPTQGYKPGLLHCGQTLYCLSHQGIPTLTNPRQYQKVRTHRNETTGIQDPASPNHQQYPVQDVSSKQQTKQKCKPNHQQTGLPSHSALPIRGKTNKQKLAQISLCKKLTQTTGPTLGRQKSKGKKNSTFFNKRIQLSLKSGKRRPKTQ